MPKNHEYVYIIHNKQQQQKAEAVILIFFNEIV
jgi:hypothetical protein